MNKKVTLSSLLALAPAIGLASDGVVTGGEVTAVRAYEKADGSTAIFLAINGNSRVGPNPLAPSTNCELWTYTKDVYSLALTAKTSGQRVNIRYVARGDNDAYCKVRYMEIIN
jgi:hypothetical protein